MKIKKAAIQTNTPEGYGIRAINRARKPIIYFWPSKETTQENLVNRRNRPYKEWKKLIPQVLEQLNIENPGYKWTWSQYAGCSCPCSPGFIPSNMSSIPSNKLTGHCIHVDLEA